MAEPLFVDAFLEVAATHGDRTALVDGVGGTLCYRELLERSRRLASTLVQRGVEPGDLVALELPRSLDTVVAMLAVWLARAAFVPIDPSLPGARRASLIDDARPRCTLGRDDLATPVSAPPIAFSPSFPDDVAYVIYTSGSTGAPKGVRVAHRGLVPMLSFQRRSFGLVATSRALLYLSTSFDASISDIGTTLLSGATLYLVDAETIGTPARLLDLLARHDITHVDLPPALLALIDPKALPPSFETIVIGGEVCPIDVVRAFAERVRLVSVYGPTEATICTSLVVCDARTWRRPSIGAPIPGIEYTVVDDALTPVVDGTPGELLIRGRGLALGYLRRPELERTKFVETASGRAYRTGDRVVRHEDGDLEFLGRVDRQLKVRGQLVEPEEIEACLARHPSVKYAAVVHRTLDAEASGERGAGLVAFVVADGATVSQLRAHVLGTLPRWMCPARFEHVATLPRSITGKVDLPALCEVSLSPREPIEPPRGARESMLAEVFAFVLGVDAISRDDDFFALGGTSLGVLQALAMAEARGVPLSAETLYQHPTVAGLAASSILPSGIDARALVEDAQRALRAGGSIGVRTASCAGRGLFVTGATGFLGARVLHQLLAREEDRTIACLVRASDAAEGMERIRAAMARQGLDLTDVRRLRIVIGDVRRRHFGLDGASFETLAKATASVHHLAADVNLALPYARLRDTNVLGAAHVRALGRDVHHASTLSVLACASPRPARAMEDGKLEVDVTVLGGYAQSKWAAERVLHDARTTVRFGLLTGDSSTGRGAPSCQLMSFVRGVAQLGVFPDVGLDGLAVDVTPIDCAARAYVQLTERARDAADERVFHVANTRSLRLDDLLRALRAYGVTVRPTGRSAFLAKIAHIEMDRTMAITFLATCRRLFDHDDRHATSDLFLATGIAFDTTRTHRALAPLGWTPPSADRALLFRYFDAALGGAP